MKIQKNCRWCKKTFSIIPSRLQKGRGEYCSKKCENTFNNNPTKCLKCGKSFSRIPYDVQVGKGKYCSVRCRIAGSIKKISKECIECRQVFSTLPSRLRRKGGKYCSLECMYSNRIQRTNKKFEKAKQGAIKPTRKRGWLDIQWSKKIKKRDRKCAVCNNYATDAHHLLERVYYPLLWLNENNGIGLCNFCHHQTHGRKLLVYPCITCSVNLLKNKQIILLEINH